jgi:signal transduction histidine kinase
MLALLRGATQREWAWLGASLLVAAAVVVALLGFARYEDGLQVRAVNAAAAELAASRVNALEWQAIAQRRLTPAMRGRVTELLGAIEHRLVLAGPDPVVRAALSSYSAAIRVEFGLLAAGRFDAARRVDAARVDRAYGRLSGVLEQNAATDLRSADRAGFLADAGDIAAMVLGFGVVALLVLRFGVARRALATSEVEQRLLRENDRAKNELISVVSHDLRTPLTSVVGYIEMVADGDAGPLTGEQGKLLGIVLRNAERLQAIVDDLLFISQVRVGKMVLSRQELSLERVAADAVDAQRPNAARNEIALGLAVAPSPLVLADRHRVDEMLENLLSNALKFTQPGGSVKVAVQPADGRVRLEVSDTGAGISAEDQLHLFEEFFRSRDMARTPGVGLGLSIVKALADAHDATLSVRSTLGEGTTFGLEFPAVASPATAPGARCR